MDYNNPFKIHSNWLEWIVIYTFFAESIAKLATFLRYSRPTRNLKLLKLTPFPHFAPIRICPPPSPTLFIPKANPLKLQITHYPPPPQFVYILSIFTASPIFSVFPPLHAHGARWVNWGQTGGGANCGGGGGGGGQTVGGGGELWGGGGKLWGGGGGKLWGWLKLGKGVVKRDDE